MLRRNLITVIAATGIAACASAPQPTNDSPGAMPVYPPPPEPARFVFERTIIGSADIEVVDRETKWRRALTGETVTTVGFSKPFDVEVCQGTIFISDTVGRQVFVLDVPSGSFDRIGSKEPGMLRKPLGMATDEDCNLYVADQSAARIVMYDRDGEFLNAFGGSGMFDRLSHVEVDPAGERLYAVDTGGVRSERHHVRVFDTRSGELLFDIGERGTEDGQFNLPRDIALAVDGNLYVVDGGNFRVQVFDGDGRFIRKIGSIGSRTGQFSRPKGIDTDSQGNIYVADAAFGNFQIFNTSGELLLFVGNRSSTMGPGKYMLPAGLAVDEDNRVYMVDQFFRKIDVFRPADLAPTDGFLGARVESPN